MSKQQVAPTIGFYSDLGITLGAGHLIRTLQLAHAMQQQGYQANLYANFADTDKSTSRNVAWLADRARQFNVAALQADSFQVFIQAAKQASQSANPWQGLIVDSYLVKPDDFEELSQLQIPIFALDDVNDRALPVTGVINVNPISKQWEKLYQKKWGVEIALCGVEYALLDPKFAQKRKELGNYQQRDWKSRQLKAFVVLGGTDTTGKAAIVAQGLLTGAARANQAINLEVIATGVMAEKIRDLVVPAESTLVATAPVSDMGTKIAAADLVVTTPSSTAWETACVGAPFALVVSADNQLLNYEYCLTHNLALGFGDLRNRSDDELVEYISSCFLEALYSPEQLNRSAISAWEIVDGNGAKRTAQQLSSFFAEKNASHKKTERLERNLHIVAAEAKHSPLVWQWRNDPATRAVSRNKGEISHADHKKWYSRALSDKKRHLLIGFNGSEPIAAVRFDLAEDESSWEISINIAPYARGQGYSTDLILLAEAWLLKNTAEKNIKVFAEIHTENKASLHVFKKAEYQLTHKTPEWLNLVKYLKE